MGRGTAASGHLCALVTILIWGTTFLSTKVLLDSFTPVEILFTRFLLGYLALLLIRPRSLPSGDPRQELWFAAAGLCGVTLYFLLENIALTMTLASNVGIIISVAPIFTALLSRLYLDGDPLSPLFFPGCAAALGGILLLNGTGQALNVNPLGNLLALLAAGVWAVYSVLMRHIGSFGSDNILCTRRVFAWGLLLMIPALAFFGYSPDLALLSRPTTLPNLLYLGLGASALCFVTWNQAVRLLGAVKTSAYIYLVPLITLLFSALLLKEPVTAPKLAGMALILVGLALSEGRLSRHRKGVVPCE